MFFLPVQAFQEQSEDSGERSFDSLQKSLLIPGWGQIAEKKVVKGVLFLSAELACLYKILENNHKGNTNYELYKAAESLQEAVFFRDLTEQYDKRRNIFIFGAVGIWAVNLIDIFFIVKKKRANEEHLSLTFEAGPARGLIARLMFSF